jgi:hypothetical protein
MLIFGGVVRTHEAVEKLGTDVEIADLVGTFG